MRLEPTALSCLLCSSCNVWRRTAQTVANTSRTSQSQQMVLFLPTKHFSSPSLIFSVR